MAHYIRGIFEYQIFEYQVFKKNIHAVRIIRIKNMLIEDPITNSENKQPNEDCSTDDYDSENEYELEYEDSNTITMDQGIQYSPYVDKLLYDGCTITIFNAMIMILYFVLSSSIPFSHVTKLLLLISYLLPCENRLKKTKHLFYKYLQDYLPHMKRFHCCLYCRKVSDRGKVCQYCKKSFGGYFLYQSKYWRQPKRNYRTLIGLINASASKHAINTNKGGVEIYTMVRRTKK